VTPRSFLSGKVASADGTPIRGAAVYVVESPSPVQDIAQLTGEDGRFSISVPQPGNYRLGVNAPGLQKTELDVHVFPDDSEAQSIDIKMKTLEEKTS
jgi:hypothetical protein